jgi:hypothetical protein
VDEVRTRVWAKARVRATVWDEDEDEGMTKMRAWREWARVGEGGLRRWLRRRS